MDVSERRLALSGLGLFLFGLVLGFVLQAFPNPRAALTAHENAVQSGTFVVVLGLLWPRLSLGRAATPLASLSIAAFWGLQLGLTLDALNPAANSALAPSAALKAAVSAINALSSLAMVLAVGVALLSFARSPRLSAAAPAPGG